MSDQDVESRLAAVEEAIGKLKTGGSAFRPISPFTARNPFFVAGKVFDHKNMKDRTRNIWFDLGGATLRTGTPALGLQGTNTAYRAWAFDAASIEAILCDAIIPKDIYSPSFGPNVTLRLYWTNLAAGSGSVVWQFQAVAIIDGFPLNTAPAFSGASGGSITTTASPQDSVVVSQFSSLSLPANPNTFDALTLVIQRDATNGSDTLANDAGLIGVAINYTADM